ncbi:sarcosine oxidase [Murinocardiopsis flavida]|uniref:Sarcosine oxidase n=1 Tax=Murinocardiopsis flavida TaxID=645275 RepID=A0A2P8DUI9_9ACTN|nr:N-methyl-L-tryptophan oxidase [Murinocardiopsis flavida]PSL00897.1 sarcosine oxidase [Murinocardiopsis flavida]
MPRLRVGVVGTGTMGAQVLWQLSKRGVDATGFETHAPGHPRGAAGGETRLFRTIEIEDLRYAPIVTRAHEIWAELHEATGRELRVLDGSLVLGSPADPQMRTALESARRSGRPYEVYDEAELRARHPQHAPDPGDIAIWEPIGGTIKPELTVAATAGLAERNGATIHRHSPVREIRETSRGVTVATDSGESEFDRVVVAAGGWTNQLLPRFADLLTVRRLISAWFFAKEAGHLDTIPPFIRTVPNYCYGLPVPDRTAMKIGLGYDHHMAADRPDEVERVARPAELAPFRRIVERYLPGLDPDPMRTDTYIETYTPDHREWVGAHPDMPNVIVLAGFSGHGFKMCPAIGEAGAQLAIDGAPALDVGFLRNPGSG